MQAVTNYSNHMQKKYLFTIVILWDEIPEEQSFVAWLHIEIFHIYFCVCAVPAAPSKPEGERVGSTGILLSWRMPMPLDPSIHSFIIRYKEMCPYPDSTFTEIPKNLDIPETLLNTLTPGATYNIKVHTIGYTHYNFRSKQYLIFFFISVQHRAHLRTAWS